MRIGHEEGSEVSQEMTTHLDRCLGCMACVTACPSGVQYDRLIERAGPQVERHGARTRRERALRAGIFALFPPPGRLRAAVPFMNLPVPKPYGHLAPKVSTRAAFRRLPEVTPAVGERRGRIALMQGCIQRVFFGDVNAATVRVLAAHELLAEHEPRAERKPLPLKVAYHDACHLAHAQHVRTQPRVLLRGIPELEVVDPAEWEICCGSAGIYNLLQPEAAAKLGERKAANLAATGA